MYDALDSDTLSNPDALSEREQLSYLIDVLSKERVVRGAVMNPEMPETLEGARRVYQDLVNTRPPEPVSDEYLAIEGAYLRRRLRERGDVIATGNLVPIGSRPPDDRTFLIRGDITRLGADTIVNAANNSLLGCFVPGHFCIDNAIHTYAGVQLRLYCSDLMERQGEREHTGYAKITPAFNLPSTYVLHTVGPIVDGTPTKLSRTTLARCYTSCLDISLQHDDIHEVAFCCISTGVFGFPRQEAAQIAVAAVRGWLIDHPGTLRVIFDVFKDEDYAIYQGILCEATS